MDRSTPIDDDNTCEEMNEYLINLVTNEEFGHVSIVAYDNDETPEIILLLDDVSMDEVDRRDTII